MIIHVGIDVSKDKLDFYRSDNERCDAVENKPQAIRKAFKSLPPSSCKVILEATGKYHRTSHRVLAALGFEVILVNPYQVRNFARALNLQCKTDKLDAKVLSQYAQKMPTEVRAGMSKLEEDIQELTRHLDDLKPMRKVLKCRRHEAKGFVKKSLEKSIKALDKEIDKTSDELDKQINSSDELREKSELLQSIPGVGSLTAHILLSLVRELGKLSKAEIASLTGLAPMNWDSGKSQGKRRIGRGRHDVRRHLYMPVLGSISRHNSRLKEIYQRLVKAGKPKMVAITACMRKLVVWANAILASGKKWDPATI